MNAKNLVINTISHQNIEKISLIYRGEPKVNNILINYFNLNILEDDWEKLIKLL